MISEIHSIEPHSATDAGDGTMSSTSSNEVNMTNCYKHCQHFFKQCKDNMIHFDVLISYWMMAGYLINVESVEEAYKKGHGFLRDLIRRGWLKPSDQDSEMIELVPSTNRIQTCRHGFGPCDATRVGFDKMLDVDRIEKVVLTDGMMKKRKCSVDTDYLCRQVFQSQRGLKYIAQFNPTPNSLKPFLENVNKPSALMLRGCYDDHLFRPRDFTFEKFKTLTFLEISGSSILNTVLLNPTVSKLTQLRYLYLSDSSIDSLPEGLFLELLELRWLILRGCSRLDFDSDIDHLWNLEVLDLSYTSTTRIPDTCMNLTHLFLRDSKLHSGVSYISREIKVLDLSGNRNVNGLSRYFYGIDLVLLDLSRTQINDTGFLEGLVSLRSLILRECTSLEHLPEMKSLTDLEVLDISGYVNLSEVPEDLGCLKNLKELNLSECNRLEHLREGVFDQMSSLVKLDLSATKLKRLPSFAKLTSLRKLTLRGLELDSLEVESWTSLSNLIELDLHGLEISTSEDLKLDFLQSLLNLQTLNLSKTLVAKLPDISMLGRIKELLVAEPTTISKADTCGTDEIGSIGEPATISKAVEFHLVYDVGQTAFDRFIYEFERIDALISEIQRSKTANNGANYFEKQLERLHVDIKYIEENIDRLKNSPSCESSEELLQELVDAATRLSAADFKDDSPNLKQLVRVVVKLKLLFPPVRTNDRRASVLVKKMKQPMFLFPTAQNVAEIVEDHPQQNTDLDLDISYQSLTRTQKDCLLCFSAFPCNEEEQEKSLVIKKSILIYWWVGEGFIDPHCDQENATLEKESFSKYCYPRPGGGRRKDLKMKDLKIIEDDGKQILQVLLRKGFIEHVEKKRRKSASFRMRRGVHSFVASQAKIEYFFDFNRENNSWLAPYVTRSTKNSQRELESVRNVLTLFNANGSVIDIKPECFSKMKQLSVLSLGSWGCSENANHIDIQDQKILEELKSMKQLRLISLQGLTTIMKLPDSICMLSNLMILDLRECGYLEELPAGIGSLRNLIHLDLTDCVILTKMPKGISLLSNLQVLRGFKITCEQPAVGDQNAQTHKITKSSWEKTMKGCASVIHGKENEACTLSDLSKLEKLNKLSLVVNMKEFPNHGDLEVLKGMKHLRMLKILWERSSYANKASGSHHMTHEEPGSPREHHFTRRLDSLMDAWTLEKLELWCIPYKTLPEWLDPWNFDKLEKLYIVGGDLVWLDSPNEASWSHVKTLRLKYLRDMKNSPYSFKHLFPMLTYIGIQECNVRGDSIQKAAPDNENIWSSPSGWTRC